MRAFLFSLFLLALPLAGCSDDPASNAPQAGAGSGGGSGAGQAGGSGAAGSAGQGGGGQGAPLLDPPADGKGVQLTMQTRLASGVEIERCKLFKLPPEGLAINAQELRFSQGSHHVLLYSTSYKEIPTQTEDGRPFAPGDVVDCANGAPDAFKIDRVIGGSQTAKGPNLFGQLPPDAALSLPGGSVVLVNAHYINTTDSELTVDVAINLLTVPPEQVKHEAGVIFFYNPFIRVPAHGKDSARMRCPVPHDINVFNLQSHMHRRGIGYEADLLDAQGKQVEQLYTNTLWEDVPVQVWPQGKKIEAGSWIDYRCDYDNKEDHAVIQGTKTTDEMCMLIGAYYPKDERFEVCQNQQGVIAGVWRGDGKASCGEALGCIQASGDSDEGLYGCIVDTCEQVGPQLSEFLRCQSSQGSGACDADCSKGPDSCSNCMQTACKSTLDACIAATCD